MRSREQAEVRGWEAPAGTRSRLRGAGLLVLALVAVALAGVLLADGGDESTVPVEPEPTGPPAPEPYGEISALPEAPIAPRSGAEHAWTGEELIVWGGASGDERDIEFHRDGAAFRPSSGTWRRIAVSPLAPRLDAAVAWGDGRLALWGGSGEDFRLLADGALYGPDDDVWEILPPSPLRGRSGATAAWTQDGELLVFGGAVLPGPPAPGTPSPGPAEAPGQPEVLLDGARFNPATAAWRMLPQPPVELEQSPWVQSVWVHDRLLVWDGQVVAAYVPAADRWETVDPPALTRVTGARYIAAIGEGQALFTGAAAQQDRDAFGLRYDVDDGWVGPVRAGPHAGSSRLRPYASGDGLLFLLPTMSAQPPDATRRREPPPALWDARLDRWLPLPPGIGAGRSGYAAAWTGEELLIWGGYDGSRHHADGQRWRLGAGEAEAAAGS